MQDELPKHAQEFQEQHRERNHEPEIERRHDPAAVEQHILDRPERRIGARRGSRLVGHLPRLHYSPYAAFFLALSSLRLIRTSAICTAFSAAPLRKLSETHHSTSPLSTVGSVRMRLM